MIVAGALMGAELPQAGNKAPLHGEHESASFVHAGGAMKARGRIYVDADACPVKAETVKVAARHGLQVIFVANSWMQIPRGAETRLQVVAGGFDAADDWIVEQVGPDDIVVTADIPLASRCLELGACVLGPSGRPFTEDNIGNALANRELMTELRAYGVGGGPPPFDKRDRSRFLEALELAARQVKREP
jgi:hypothetical protein